MSDHRLWLEESGLSYAAIAAVLARPAVSAGERLAAFSLASYANRDELAWPGTSVAAARAGMSASAFLEARDRLGGKASTLRLLFAQTGPWWESDINVELLEAVLCRSRASGSARVLLAVLAALSDKDGVVEDRSTDELRRAAGMADSTYRRARTALLQAGEAAVAGDRGGRGVKSRWTVPHPRELGRCDRQRDRVRSPSNPAPRRIPDHRRPSRRRTAAFAPWRRHRADVTREAPCGVFHVERALCFSSLKAPRGT